VKIILSLFFFFCIYTTQSQIVLEFKDVIDREYYQYCLEFEASLDEIQDPVIKANKFYELGRKSNTYNEDLSLKYENIALEIFKLNGHDSLYHKVRSSMTINYNSKGKYEISQGILEENLKFWNKRGTPNAAAQEMKKLGYVHQLKGNYIKAMDYYLQCYRIQSQFYEMSKLGDITNRLVANYRLIGDCKTAIKYAEVFIKSKSKSGFKRYESNVMRAIAYCYAENGQDSISNLYLRLTSDMWKNSKSTKLKVYAYRDLYEDAMLNEKFELAKQYLDTASMYANQFANKKLLAKIENRWGKYNFQLTNYKTAKKHFLKSLDYTLESHELTLESDNYKQLSNIAFELGDFKNSLGYFKKYDSLRLVLFSDKVSEEIKQLDIRIQREQSEEEIRMLEEQNKLKEINLKNERNIKFFLIGLLLSTLALLSLIYFLYKQRANSNKELKDKNHTISKALKTNKMLMKEIHHRVKNNLQVVSSLLFLQSRFMEDESAKGAIKTGRSRVQAMSILHQKLYQKEDLQSVNIKSYFEDLSSNLFNTYRIQNQNIIFNSEIEDIELDVDIVIPMGLITNELISNALKHAFKFNDKGYIKLSIGKVENEIILKVEDNGKGLPFEKFPNQTDSLGIDLIKSFAEKLDAEILIDNANGASVTIKFDSHLNLN